MVTGAVGDPFTMLGSASIAGAVCAPTPLTTPASRATSHTLHMV